jgi:hypothetical protein
MKDSTTADANRLFELLRARAGLSESQSGRLADGFAGLHERTRKLFDHQISALIGQLESPDPEDETVLDEIRETCWQIHNHPVDSRLVPQEGRR